MNNKSRRWQEESDNTWETPAVLSQVSGNGRQSRKDTNSSYVSQFICELICCQHLYLAVDPVTVDSSSSAQLWAALLPIACVSSLLPISPSSLLSLPHSTHRIICANHCSSKAPHLKTQVIFNERAQTQHTCTCLFMFLSRPVRLQHNTVTQGIFQLIPAPLFLQH